MENQNIQWENWGEQPQETNEQPQVNWGEQPQETNEQPQVNWEDATSAKSLPNNASWEDISNSNQHSSENPINFFSNNLEQDGNPNFNENGLEKNLEEVEIKNWVKKSSCLGLVTRLDINALLYKLNYDDSKVLEEINNSGYEPLNKDNQYKTKFEGNSELTSILTAIKNIGEERGLKLDHTFIYKNEPKASTLNMSRGECFYNFIYFLQANHKSGDVILDFSSLKGGPSVQALEASTGILALLPGWVPYSISKNESDRDMIAIAGRFVPFY